jgi:hypothetical protein
MSSTSDNLQNKADVGRTAPVTEEGLKQLPRWAIVAFATRCARRVQPLFVKLWPDAPKEHVQGIDQAIKLAEAAASGGAASASTVAANAPPPPPSPPRGRITSCCGNSQSGCAGQTLHRWTWAS